MWTGRDFAKVKLVERSYAYGQRPMDEVDEYYSNMDHVKQHPWYANSMIIMLIVLVAAIFFYSGYALFTWRCAKRASLYSKKPASHETQCIVDDMPRNQNQDASPQK
jgi:hypothetical protein